LSPKTRCSGAAVLILATLLFSAIACFGDGERRVVFEEIGEYADGGMAVALLVVGDLVYLCEFDRGVVILDVSDPGFIHIPQQGDMRGVPRISATRVDTRC